MVRNGYAVAYRRYSKDYIEDEEYAKKNKIGLWSGNFIHPEKWRKLKLNSCISLKVIHFKKNFIY